MKRIERIRRRLAERIAAGQTDRIEDIAAELYGPPVAETKDEEPHGSKHQIIRVPRTSQPQNH